MKHTILLALLILTSPPAASAQDYYPSSPNVRTIASSGSATVNVVPDQFYVGIGIENFNGSLETASSTNTASTKKIVAALKDLGVVERKITVDALTVDIKYINPDHPSNGIEGYFARKSLTVIVDSASLAEQVVASSLRNGANRVLGIQYNTTSLRQLRDEARKSAARAAREKAELIATTLGAKVGKPLSVNEGYSVLYGSSMWSPYGYYGRSQMMGQNVSSSSGGGGESSDVVPAGEMAVQANVNVTFELLP